MTTLFDRNRLLADIKAAEGCQLTAYKDTLGNWTIGYGHLLSPSVDWAGTQWTQGQANSVLEFDIHNKGIVPAQLFQEFQYLDTAARQNALAEICFNMGAGNFRKFINTRAAIRAKDWSAVRAGLLDSEWAKQVQPNGLVDSQGRELAGRATRLADYLFTGNFENPIGVALP